MEEVFAQPSQLPPQLPPQSSPISSTSGQNNFGPADQGPSGPNLSDLPPGGGLPE